MAPQFNMHTPKQKCMDADSILLLLAHSTVFGITSIDVTSRQKARFGSFFYVYAAQLSPPLFLLATMAPINVLVSGLPSTLCLRLGSPLYPLSYAKLTAALTTATGLPDTSFYLRQSATLLSPSTPVTSPGQHTAFIHLSIRHALPGGKGGFGALLKGSASSSHKSSNFDACRDLQGRRLRHLRDEAALANYRRTSAGQPTRSSSASPSSSQEKRAFKRPRTPPCEDPKQSVEHDMNVLTARISDGVAAGLRAAALRKRQRTENPSSPRDAQRVQHSPNVSFGDKGASREKSPSPASPLRRVGVKPVAANL